MTRITLLNFVKVAAALFFFPFAAFLLLVVGVGAKNKRVVLEGGAYGAAFLLAVFGPLGGVGAFVGLGSWVLSIVRALWLRDLWLHARPRVTGFQAASPLVAASGPTPQFVAAPAWQPAPAASTPLTGPLGDLPTALAWVSSTAKQNKHRLPAGAYVTVLELCQTLDAVIDAEVRQPSRNAAFEYELEAIVRQYLPMVLQGYLGVPANMLELRQPNGRTPNQELQEQLQLLSRQAEALHASRYGQVSAELSSTGNFLRERFGHQQRGGFDFGIS